MTTDDDPIAAAIQEVVRELPKVALQRILKEKFSDLGIAVEPEKLRKASQHFLSGGGEFHFGNEQADATNIELTEEDENAIVSEVEAFIRNDLPAIISKAADEAADGLYDALKRKWAKEHRQQIKDLSRFRKRLEYRYGPGLDRLRMLLTIAVEWSQERYAHKITVGQGQLSDLDDILHRLHARACQVTAEILALLSTGLSDGAMARWRTLHEIATVAVLIGKYGNEVAERYVKYQIVESKKALTAYDECHEDLGYDQYPPEMKLKINNDYAEVIAEYGKSYGEQYGWISHILGEGESKRVTFATLQKAAGMGLMRAHYQMASYNVHASPKGIYFKLGQLEQSTKILLAGMSNAGLVEPAQNAAITLSKTTLLVCNDEAAPAFENNVFVKVVDRLAREIPSQFAQADAKLKLDDRFVRRFNRDPNAKCTLWLGKWRGLIT